MRQQSLPITVLEHALWPFGYKDPATLSTIYPDLYETVGNASLESYLGKTNDRGGARGWDQQIHALCDGHHLLNSFFYKNKTYLRDKSMFERPVSLHLPRIQSCTSVDFAHNASTYHPIYPAMVSVYNGTSLGETGPPVVLGHRVRTCKGQR